MEGTFWIDLSASSPEIYILIQRESDNREWLQLITAEALAAKGAMLAKDFAKESEAGAKTGIKPEDVITCRPADLLEPELPKYREEYTDLAKSEEDEHSHALFPQVAPKVINRRNLRTPKPLRMLAPIVHPEKHERAVAPFSRK